MRYGHILVLTGTLLVSACGTAQDSPELVTTSSGAEAIVQTSSLRSVLVSPADKRVHYCAEPAPDVALDTIREITAALKAKAGTLGDVANPELDANASYKLTATARELAGRSTTVVLARDLLFRLCELSVNFAHQDSDKFKAIAERYDNVVDKVIAVLAEADKKNAEAALVEAQVEAATILGGQEARITAIVGAVGGDKLDSEKLKALVAKAKLSKSVAREINGATSVDDLRDRLRFAGPNVVSAIFGAI